jgi:hypothetical protein
LKWRQLNELRQRLGDHGCWDKPGATYSDGWNDCLAAMKKAEDGWFKRMDANFRAKIVPIRKP